MHAVDGRIVVERRLDYSKVAPQGISALRNLHAHIDSCGLERALLDVSSRHLLLRALRPQQHRANSQATERIYG